MIGEMSRTCPDCRSALETKTLEGITIDACPSCAGIFFDEGEVCQLKAKGLQAFDAVEDAVVPSIVVEHSSDRSRMCPSCHTGMDKFRYLYNSRLILDECERCGGIWVQDGELGKMKEVLEECLGHGKGKPVTVVTGAHPATAVPEHYRGRMQRVHEFLTGVGRK